MKDIREAAFFFESGYADRAAGGRGATDTDDKSKFYPEWSNFTFRNITSVNAKKAVDITGLKGLPVHDLLFDGVSWYGTREGMEIKYAEKLTFMNCTITPQRENEIKHCKNITWNGNPLEND
jgi:hypothetical protein